MNQTSFFKRNLLRFCRTLPIAMLVGMLGLTLGCSREEETEETRNIKFYQSPMHPWITSEEPGNCTICGMALTPVYEGESGGDLPDDVIKLSPTSINVINVGTVPVRREVLQRTIHVSGILDDNENKHRMVAAHYDGRIEEVFIEHAGQFVSKEQPLASIYSPELLYVVREFQNAIKGNDRSVAENAARRLVQFGLTTQQVNRLARNKEEEYAVEVLAPMDGTILVRSAYPGEYVEEGETIYEIGDLSVLWFHAEVYESDLAGIRIGQKASVRTPAVPGRTFEGTVTFIDPNFDPMTRSTRLRIEVPNPVQEDGQGMHRIIPHRAYAEAEIHADFGERLVAPRSAVLNDGRRAVAYIDRGDGAYKAAIVQTGYVGDDLIEIVGGVEEGDRLVAQGNLLIDAEAQMRQGAILAEPERGESVDPSTAALLGATAKASDALARDDLAAYVPMLPEIRSALKSWDSSAFPAQAEPAAHLTTHGMDATPGDLAAARKQFLPLSELVAAVALEAGRSGKATDVAVFSCPMTDTSFEGAPEEARWVQQGNSARNPWFGAQMLDCGLEVKP